MSAAPQSVVVVGASLAGLSTARALRAQGYTGTLTIIGDEIHRPYDRPPLSKEFLHTLDAQVELSLEAEGEDLDATWRLGERAAALRPLPGGGAEVELRDGTTVSGDRVVIATGASARSAVPGVGLPGVHLLRTLDDATALRQDLHDAVTTGRPVVVVGGGFIGSEVAATARQLGCRVSLVVPDDVPLRAALGPYAEAITDLHIAARRHDPGTRPGRGRPGRRRRPGGDSGQRQPDPRRHGGAGHRRGPRGRLARRFRTGSGRERGGRDPLRRARCDQHRRCLRRRRLRRLAQPRPRLPLPDRALDVGEGAGRGGRGPAAGSRADPDLPGAVRVVRSLRQEAPAGRLPRPGRSSQQHRAHPRSRLARRGRLHRRLPQRCRSGRRPRPRPAPTVRRRPSSPRDSRPRAPSKEPPHDPHRAQPAA